ncbi:hypothetical protein NMG60_11013567 [Bertholletia excelsa]
MSSKARAGKKNSQDSGNGKLLNDIEAISKALNLDRTRSSSSRSTLNDRSVSSGKAQLVERKSKARGTDEELLRNEKKSIWSWKALKAFSHVRHRKFDCCFSLEVHNIEGLPPHFDNLCLCVHWKRRDGGLLTRPARVYQGIAEFEDHLTHTCSVYGSRSGSHHPVKYEAKYFLLYAAVHDSPELDFGKHRVDLTRLLPLTLEELEDEKSSGKWTTSYKLSGMAKGACLNVSFGYTVIGAANKDVPVVSVSKWNSTSNVRSVKRIDESDCRVSVHRSGSMPVFSSTSSRPVEDIKDLHEVLPTSSIELFNSVTILNQKFDEDNRDSRVNCKPNVHFSPNLFEPLQSNSLSSDTAGKQSAQKDHVDGEFSTIDHGIELFSKDEDVTSVVVNASETESIDLPEADTTVGIATKEDNAFPSKEWAKPEDRNLMAADASETESSDLPKVDTSGGIAIEGNNVLLPKEQVKPEDGKSVAANAFETVSFDLPRVATSSGIAIEEDNVLLSKEEAKPEDRDLMGADASKIETIDPPKVETTIGIAVEDDTKIDSLLEELCSHRDDFVVNDCISEENNRGTKELLMKDIELALHNVLDVAIGADSPKGGSRIPDQDTNTEFCSHMDEFVMSGAISGESDICTKELLRKEMKSSMHDASDPVIGVDSPKGGGRIPYKYNDRDVKSDYKISRIGKSLSLDDITNSVASDFLDMLGIDHSPFGLSSESEPESPRERLLRQFEKESLAAGRSLFDFDIDDENQCEVGCEAQMESGWGTSNEDIDLYPVSQAAGVKDKLATQQVSRTRASMLEDLETEALMHEWGLNEKAFQRSPSNHSGGFGSPVDLLPEEPPQLPPLGEGLGPFLQTKNGGFLRSMNPTLFRNAKSGGNLIMQVSSPVVVPAEMGSSIMEILQRLASIGIEKLSMQANKLMPLEDVTGQTMQQIAWEAAPTLEAPDERQVLFQQEVDVAENTAGGQKEAGGKSPGLRSRKVDSSSIGKDMDSEYVSLEDLAPLAMDKIEALSIEGLRIQSGISDEDAPANINPQSIGEISALEGKRTNFGGTLGLEGAGGLQLLDIKDDSGDVDGLMGLSLTLDEWMRLDSGEIDDEDQISERTSKILAAHHATCTGLMSGRPKADKRRGKGSGRKCGLLGNNFTVALMVQLRDPLRNYEPVGTPMLALIQVERVFVPPKPKIYSTVSEVRNSSEEEDESEPAKNKEIKEELKEEENHEQEAIPQFKVTEVHVAGLKTEPGKKKIWGSTAQQQSGSRWLLANGMGKSNKHPFMKSKAAAKSASPATTTVQPGETLWSISARVHGTGAKWKELAKLNPHIRNPNIIIPNETIRLR